MSIYGSKKTSSTGRKNPPISPATGFSIQEVFTLGMKLRFQAVPASKGSVKGPLRKSYNSAAADTHRL